MKRFLLSTLLAVSLTAAEQVHITERGKTYHRTEKCMTLSRATKVYSVTESAALAHGLRKCGVCWRPAKAKKQTDSGWMK